MAKPYLIPADYLRDNPFAEKHMYKIYHDGSHYVATRIVRSKGKRPPTFGCRWEKGVAIREDGCESYTDYLKKGIIELGF